MLSVIPSAFALLDEIDPSTSLAVFLDYDGTLTPIVMRPEEAILADATREVVRRLALVADVAVVSGRALDDVRAHVAVPGIAYSGSHGLEMEHRGGHRSVPAGADEFIAPLRDAANRLRKTVLALPGTLVEEKPLAVAVHFRETPEHLQPLVQEIVTEVGEHFPTLRASRAKKVLELRPNVAWSKGAAIATFMQEFGGEASRHTVLALGDDTTDEDAYPVVQSDRYACGAGIFVGERLPRNGTLASHTLRQWEVRDFLIALTDRFEPINARDVDTTHRVHERESLPVHAFRRSHTDTFL